MRMLAPSLCATMLALAASMAAPLHAKTAFSPTQVDGGAGSTTAVAQWQIQSSAKAQQDGAAISSSGFSTHGWYPVSGRATVMAGLLENGTYKSVFYSDNLRAVQVPDASGNLFVNPWWYRTEFTLAKDAAGMHTLLRTNGIIASADVWVNGHQVADHAAVAGAYPVHLLDVTRWVHAGNNVLALRVHPSDPRRSLSIGWVDWNPTPPDDSRHRNRTRQKRNGSVSPLFAVPFETFQLASRLNFQVSDRRAGRVERTNNHVGLRR